VAQHWRELQWIHLAVVGPGRFIAAGRRISADLRLGACVFCLALSWSGGGIGTELVVTEIVFGKSGLAD
tara:strand:- start:309 stop:515 length:207 start_codon:yes stop_codon:yes gene_type:complete